MCKKLSEIVFNATFKSIFHQTWMSAGRAVGVSTDVRIHQDRLDVLALLDTDSRLMAELVWVSITLRFYTIKLYIKS